MARQWTCHYYEAALAIFLFYGFWRILSSGADLHFAPDRCCLQRRLHQGLRGRMAEGHPPSRSTFTIRIFYNGHCSDDSSAMSIDVALSTHYGARRNTAIILRASRLAPRHVLSGTSMDMPLLPAAIFLFYGFCHFASSGADLLFAAFCCIFAVEMKIRASVGPFFRVLKALPRFGRLFFLSPKP